jgi:hypothetical protein
MAATARVNIPILAPKSKKQKNKTKITRNLKNKKTKKKLTQHDMFL